ncbi:MAG: glycosyl transferase family 1 [Dehalococcoidia bacterium]|nr:MAG: glycosyl transferase family 1 [Dehalococcoidia bacterium]
MRVAFIVYGSIDQRSGGYLYDRMLVRQLRAAGDHVDVIGLTRRPYGLALLDNFRGLAAALARRAPDLVVQDELCHPSLCWVNRAIARRLGRPIVSIVHHLRASEQPHDPLACTIEHHYLASLDALIANSWTTARTVRTTLGRLPQCHVALPGRDRLGEIAPPVIARRASERRPLRVVTVGNLEPRKNVETLLAALARLPANSWELKVVGGVASPQYAARLRTWVTKLGLRDAVQFCGPLEDGALGRLLAESDVFAQPSWYEGFGVAALEAMGFGLPAIASRAGGAVELITHGEDGFLVAPNDVDSVAGALYQLLDRSGLERMSLAALARYNRHPMWQETMAEARAFLAMLQRGGNA